MTDQKRIDECYSIETKDGALECMKELVKTATGSCRPRLVLLTQESCIPCEEERALHQKDILNGTIQELSIDTPEGLKVASKNKLEFIPALLLLDCEDKVIYPSG